MEYTKCTRAHNKFNEQKCYFKHKQCLDVTWFKWNTSSIHTRGSLSLCLLQFRFISFECLNIYKLRKLEWLQFQRNAHFIGRADFLEVKEITNYKIHIIIQFDCQNMDKISVSLSLALRIERNLWAQRQQIGYVFDSTSGFSSIISKLTSK